MSEAVIAKLAERGFWRVEIRPTQFRGRRVESVRTLRSQIEKCRVEFRGWDFPHLPSTWDLPESQDWIGHVTDWSVHVEAWRAFLSGQFVFRGSVWTDWLDQHHFNSSGHDWKPRTGLPIVSALWSITEFWEFAARYSQTDAGDDSMYVEVSFHGLGGRVLFGDHKDRHWSRNYGPARMETFRFSKDLSRTELITSSKQLAVRTSIELFEVFGWTVEPALLESIQAELLTMRRGV